MIALGVVIFLLLTLNHPIRKRFISIDHYFNLLFIGLMSGLAGGRIMHIVSYPDDFKGRWIEVLYPWVEGLTLIGAIIGVAIGCGLYLAWKRITILPIFDMAALYIPLTQAISRLGCLGAGCCYGAVAYDHWWAITFTNPAGNAPLFVPLHPTQLYLSAAALIIFFYMQYYKSSLLKRAGLASTTYFMLENVSRFVIDFWRGDRDPLVASLCDGAITISQVQLYAIIGLVISVGICFWLIVRSTSINRYY
jgi:phosphatidylglycerol---prolipoprotein diacylglyceryl transferase